MLIAVLAVLGGIFGWWMYKGIQMGKAMAAQKPPPVAVSATTAKADAWQPSLHAVGSIAAVQGVVITNEQPGTVAKIAFESGDAVKAGDLLVALDTSVEEAQLNSTKATAELARQTLSRAETLRKSSANAQADLDAAQAQFTQATAQVEQLKATIAKKRLTAPFAGRLGIRKVDLGQFLAAGTAIVSLESLDSVYVNFTLPQKALSQVKVGQQVEIKLDAYQGRTFAGTITSIDPRLDAATRSVNLQATLPNQDEALKPGMFVEADVLLPQQDQVVTVPQTAITYNPYGDVIYVIEPAKKAGGDAAAGRADDLVVRQQFVTVGATRGDQVAIVKGVKPGERVVTAGQLKLRNGVSVSINNSVPVASDPSPQPPNT
jgi:membrane fusion protein (multidrug efflux system)